MDIFDLFGWIGTILIVLAYYLLSHHAYESNSSGYQLLNLLGAILIGIHVFHDQSWPTFTLQIVWGIIALTALIKIRRKSRRS